MHALILALALLFAQDGQVPLPPQPQKSPEEQCKDQCHIDQCTCHNACWGKDSLKCKDRCMDEEVKCWHKCKPPLSHFYDDHPELWTTQ